jgi:PAS domain S-box-containing protein
MVAALHRPPRHELGWAVATEPPILRVETSVAAHALQESTDSGAKRIFFRFVLVAVGVNALVGAAVVSYNVATSLNETEAFLGELGESQIRMTARLRGDDKISDAELMARAAALLDTPMALFSREGGVLVHASDPAIARMIKQVWEPDGLPRRGTQIRITDKLQHLSGAWTLGRLSERHDLLVVIPRLPEDEGLAVYMTIAAGLTGVGLAFAFIVMLAAANWMIRRPLSRLVKQLTGALARDVQRRKEAEETAVAARQEAEKHLAFMNSLIDASESVGIVAMDAQGMIQIFNWAAVRILGYSASEVVGRLTLDELRSKSLGGEELSSPLVHLDAGEEQWRDKQGQQHLLAINTSEIVDSDGTDRGHLITLVDVTERRKLEAELQLNELQLIQSAKLATLGEMATGIAHELNQPLNNIGLLSSRVLRRIGREDLGQEARSFYKDKLDKVSGQVERAGKIIDHLRAFGRPRAKELSSVQLRVPVDGVMVFLREQLHRRGIKVAIDLPGDLPQVEADEARLEQVLMNLIINARDALEELEEGRQRKIMITARRCDLDGAPGVNMQVRDTGPGIPHEVLDRIFEPFFTTKEVGKGTGLGLSISYGLVREFGGELAVESAMDEGTTFSIKLKEAADAAR